MISRLYVEYSGPLATLTNGNVVFVAPCSISGPVMLVSIVVIYPVALSEGERQVSEVSAGDVLVQLQQWISPQSHQTPAD